MYRRERHSGRCTLLAFLALTSVLCAQWACGRRDQVPPISQRGPGIEPGTLQSLALPVPRTFDLAHVESRHFATALREPASMFAFVRDQIAFEPYDGALRGARGTLLARAGNSVDRALLLADMLRTAGRRVRFAHGRLDEVRARELVQSIWARSRPSGGAHGGGASQLEKKLVSAVERDYRTLYRVLNDAKRIPRVASGSSFAELTRAARQHYWVQDFRDGVWVDVDPSANGAVPGQRLTEADETFDALPDHLFHRITLRIRVEEYSDGKASSREVLTYTLRAADLRAFSMLLTHQPESWTGPSAGLADAMTSAIGSNPRIKPVLIIDVDQVIGEAFRHKPPATGGLNGVFGGLSGEGTRRAVPIAVSETLEVHFTRPDGSVARVEREIFDAVGKARRFRNQPLSPAELDASAAASGLVTDRLFDLFFSTGAIHSDHFAGITALASDDPDMVLVNGLRRLGLAMTSASDALTSEVGDNDELARYFPDAPRLVITEVAHAQGQTRLSIDLRHLRSAAVARSESKSNLFRSNMLRGVVHTHLEHLLLEQMLADAPTRGQWARAESVAAVFERAHADGGPFALFAGESSVLPAGLPDNTSARLREDVAKGLLAIGPARQVTSADSTRYAWWRVDPASGETTGVLDNGLHGAQTVEYQLVRNQNNTKVVGARVWYVGANGSRTLTHAEIFQVGGQRIVDFMRDMAIIGARRLPSLVIP